MSDKQVWKETKIGKWLDAKFYDDESGEIFLVELKREDGEEMEDFIAKCQEVADDNFDNAVFVTLMSETDADCLGYDTY